MYIVAGAKTNRVFHFPPSSNLLGKRVAGLFPRIISEGGPLIGHKPMMPSRAGVLGVVRETRACNVALFKSVMVACASRSQKIRSIGGFPEVG